VGNAGAGHSSVETVGLRDSPHGHVAAVTPSSDAKTRRIDWVFLYCCINSGENVAQIACAKIFYIGSSELFSLTVTATRVRHQYVVTSCGQSSDDGSRHSKARGPIRRHCAEGAPWVRTTMGWFLPGSRLAGGGKRQPWKVKASVAHSMLSALPPGSGR